MIRLRRVLLWLLLLALVALGASWLVGDPTPAPARPAGDELAPPALAFWPLFVAIASAIWTGIQVAGRVTLQILAWSVKALWAFAIVTANALRAVGLAFAKFGRASWRFLQALYRHVLKPAYLKFWRLVERARAWLEKHVKPILDYLYKIRKRITDFYEHWIRPVLDVIGVTRKALRVTGLMAFEWAKTLDRWLGEAEERVSQTFGRIVAELNRIITAVDRVMTLDGLFQRLALIRSLERDVEYVFRVLHNSRSAPLTDEEKRELTEKHQPRGAAAVLREVELYIETGAGPVAERIARLQLDELALSPRPQA